MQVYAQHYHNAQLVNIFAQIKLALKMLQLAFQMVFNADQVNIYVLITHANHHTQTV